MYSYLQRAHVVWQARQPLRRIIKTTHTNLIYSHLQQRTHVPQLLLQIDSAPMCWCANDSRAFFLAHVDDYGVATISRLLKIIGLFCKRAL